MPLKSGVSGISRRTEAAGPDVQKSEAEGLSPRERLQRRAGIDASAPPRVDALDQDAKHEAAMSNLQPSADESVDDDAGDNALENGVGRFAVIDDDDGGETEMVQQATSGYIQQVDPSAQQAQASLVDQVNQAMDKANYPAAEGSEKFDPKPVGKPRGRRASSAAPTSLDSTKETAMTTVELRAAIKEVELQMKELGAKKADLAAQQGDLVTQYNQLTGQLAFALMGS